MKHKVFLFLGLFFHVLISTKGFASTEEPLGKMLEEGELNSLLLDMSATPSSIVGGAVNVITGNYFESSCDLTTPGANSISLQRIHNSGNKIKGSLCHGWDLNLPSKAIMTLELNNMVVYDRGTRLCFTESIDNFTSISEKGYITKCIGKKHLNNGVTNCSKGVLNSRTNIKNREFHYTKDGRICDMLAESGELLSYIKKDKDLDQYVLSRNKLPTGCSFKYKYDNDKRLDRVTSRGTKSNPLSFIEWIYPDKFQDNPRLLIKSSDGRQVRYKYKELGDRTYKANHRYYLSSVKSEHAPKVKYSYLDERSKFKALMIKKELPDQRYLNISYYKVGKNDVGSQYLYISNANDNRIGRVSSLYAPAGTDETPVMLWSFRYILNERINSGEICGGITEVVDGLGHRKEYKFSKEHRLESICHFKDNDELYRIERMVWENGGDKNTCLLTQGLSDSEDNLVIRRDYVYDKKGNVIRETLRGNLTGSQCNPVAWESFKDSEKHSTTFSYTDSGLLKSEDDGRKKTTFEYLPETDLLTLKLVSHNEKIYERYHFQYDANSVLIEEICDDGDSPNIANLSGVTERRIKKITPTAIHPIGLPAIVDEYSWNFITNQEQLISRLENSYSKVGKLISQKTYDSNGMYCFSKEWDYDDHGNIIVEIDPLGLVTTYQYDKNDNRIFQQTPNQDYCTHFEYDYMNRLIAQRDVHLNGLEMATSYAYDCMGNKVSATDRYKNSIEFRYDEFNRLIEKIYPPTFDHKGISNKSTDSVAYDYLNNPCSITDTNGHTSHKKYTARGKPYFIEHPDGNIEKSIYDLNGTLLQYIDTNGVTTHYTYDYKDRIVCEDKISKEGESLSTRKWIYNTFHLLEEIDPAGFHTYYQYDNSGRLLKVSKGDTEIKYFYDSLGRQSEVWEMYAPAKYRKKLNSYDILNRVVCEIDSDETERIFTKKSYKYDQDGNRTHTLIHDNDKVTCTEVLYNQGKNPTKIIYPDGTETVYTYYYDFTNKHGQNVAFHKETDANGIQTLFTKDSCGRIARVHKKDTEGKLISDSYSYYDGEGNLLRQVNKVIQNGKIQRNFQIKYLYDSSNRETTVIEAVGDPLQKITRKEYLPSGKLSGIFKPNGVVLNFNYDLLGRLIEQNSSDGSIHYLNSYDKNDNLIKINDLIHGLDNVRVMDDNNRMISEQLGTGLNFNYQYDSLGRVTNLNVPDMSSIEYIYNAMNLEQVLRNTNGNQYSFKFHFNLKGKLSSIDLPKELGSINYRFDICSRPISIKSQNWSQTIPKDGYDPCGNVLTIIQNDVAGEFTSEYTYDSLYQLTSETGSAVNKYAFDSLHNRLTKNNTANIVNALNQITNNAEKAYEYDPNGNLLKSSNPYKDIDYRYDALDRLTATISKDQKTEYIYDSFHRRLKKTSYKRQNEEWIESDHCIYLYQGDKEIGKINKDGNLVEFRTLGIGLNGEIGAAVLLEIEGLIVSPLHDFRGNVVALTNIANGKVLENYRFSSFGEDQFFDSNGKAQETALSPWRFSSKRIDEETGWAYFGRRYYDPEIGRWTTPDPIGFSDGPNVYTYVHNRPLSYIDPDGKFSHLIISAQPSVKQSVGAACRPAGLCIGRNYESLANAFINTCRFLTGELTNHSEYTRRFNVGTFVNDGIGLGFINGIRNSYKDSVKAATHFSNLAGGRQVSGIYNPSYGCLDFFECCLGLMDIPTRPVEVQMELWKDFRDNGGIHFLQGAHSQGAIHIRNAAQLMGKDFMQNFEFVGVAPAAHMPLGLFGNATHFESKNDFVPGIDKMLGGAIGSAPIVMLEPHPEASFWDHSFDSPTFIEAVKSHVSEFFNSCGAN